MTFRSKFTAAAFGFILTATLLLAAPAAQSGVFNPKTFRLGNGMEVVLVPNHRVPVVTQMVWYRVGSADEPLGKSGLAHFLEHLMFKGTDKLAAGEFSRILARNGGTENAFTSYDYTGYYQTIAASRLELVMKMEADRMTGLKLTPDDVKTERKVILEERRQRTENNPAAILGEYVNAALYLNYPYRRPVIGWDREIRNLGRRDVQAFYRRWYRPDNAVLVVAGDITVKKLKPMAERTYGRIPRPPGPPLESRLKLRGFEPPQNAPRRVTLRDSRVRQPAWSRAYLAPGYIQSPAGWNGGKGARPSDVYALQVLSEVLGGGATSPIYRSLVVERKLAVGAGVEYQPGGLGPAVFSLYASPQPGVSMEKLEAAVDEEIGKLLKHGLSEKQVNRAKGRLEASAIYARDSLGTGARVLGEALATKRTAQDVEAWPDRIRAVTTPEVNKNFRAVIDIGRSVTALLLPEAPKKKAE
jgi:zinc protease